MPAAAKPAKTGGVAKPTLRDTQKAFTRSRIVEQARKLFAQNGYYGTTVDQIASATGTSRQTFYLHFADKEAVLKEMVEQYFPLTSAVFAKLPGPLPTREEIATWMEQWAEFSIQQRSSMLVLKEVSTTALVRPRVVHGIMERLMSQLGERIPAFAATQREDERGLEARARAELVMVSMTWAAQIVIQSENPAYGQEMLNATAEMVHVFVNDSRYIAAGEERIASAR